MIAIAPTDGDWAEALSRGPQFPVVNFWTPTPWNLRRLKPGDRFYFLLKSPIRKLAGYGRFVRYENMSAKDAWDEFGAANGVRDLPELVLRASKYATKNSKTFSASDNPTIGCIVLEHPEFLPASQYLPPARAGLQFPKQVVKVKYFDADPVAPLLGAHGLVPTKGFTLVATTKGNYTNSKRKERVGQGQFRENVLGAYRGRCCVLREAADEVLEAAHIQPYIDPSSNHVQNGLALRVDLHKLFDAGLLAIAPDHTILVSRKVSSPTYRELHGKRIELPDDPHSHPSAQALEYHRSFVFRP